MLNPVSDKQSPTGRLDILKPPRPIKTIAPKAEVDASYKAATLEIRTRNPEMKADMDAVRREIGYLKPMDTMREAAAIAQKKGAEAVVDRVRDGDRTRSIHSERGNVFGRLAYDKYVRSMKVQIEMDAAPKFGVKIDVKIHPPEIKFTIPR